MYHLKLYVTGKTPSSEKLVEKLEKMMRELYGDRFRLDVLDIFEHSEEAYEDIVLATPTLIRLLPPPIRRLVGDLSDRERVLAGLLVEDGGGER
jgi:circadian clock protein KaiB